MNGAKVVGALGQLKLRRIVLGLIPDTFIGIPIILAPSSLFIGLHSDYGIRKVEQKKITSSLD